MSNTLALSDAYFIVALVICSLVFSIVIMFVSLGLAILFLVLLLPWLTGIALVEGWGAVKEEVKRLRAWWS